MWMQVRARLQLAPWRCTMRFGYYYIYYSGMLRLFAFVVTVYTAAWRFSLFTDRRLS